MAREFTTPLHWVADTDHLPGDPQWDLELKPFGFSPSTKLHGSLTAKRDGQLQVRRLLGVCTTTGECFLDEDNDPVDCSELATPTIRFPVGLSISTEDSAFLNAELTGMVTLTPEFQVVSINGRYRGDLAPMRGTLHLEATRLGPHRGQLEADLLFRDQEVRGTLTPTILPSADFTAPPWQHQPIGGRLQDDDCDMDAQLVNGTTDADRNALEVLAEAHRALSQLLSSTYPMAVQWDEQRMNGRLAGTVTNVHVDCSKNSSQFV